MASRKTWTSEEVRNAFIEFFKTKEHVFVRSSPVVPHEDPTLLFANAGMNQFKPIFLGQVDPTSDMAKLKRVVNSQKCIRAGGKHNDLEDVGRDSYHHTFFEMLGNWSFGDFFKVEAIDWAFELFINVFKLDKERLYATYFGGDEASNQKPDAESRELWLRYLPAAHVLPFGLKENFWEMGETGPCGPCSELHYDLIGGRDAAHLVNRDDPTVIELWNLVFMQFNREPSRKLTPLPAKSVDTGAGLERVTATLNGYRSNYDIDTFQSLFAAIQRETGAAAYTGAFAPLDSEATRRDTAYRVIADHLRTVAFAIADGAQPAAEGRNYVVRRVLRRAVRFGREVLGARDGFFSRLVPALVALMGAAFPELRERAPRVQGVILEEELGFSRTLDRGLRRLRGVFARLAAAGKREVPGEAVFQMYDTYGFPPDLTALMAREVGLSADADGCERLLAEKRLADSAAAKSAARAVTGVPQMTPEARAAVAAKSGAARTDDAAKYAPGVPDLETEVIAIWDGQALVDEAPKGGACAIVTRATNFYAEGGGQQGDAGAMYDAKSGATFRVDDAQKDGHYVAHMGHMDAEEDAQALRVGQRVSLSVDAVRRQLLACNHTATHLLNWALRERLGDGVQQRGSLVTPDRLRFDFSHPAALTTEDLAFVDEAVSRFVASSAAVFDRELPLQQALAIPQLRTVPNEVYPDPVRVVSVGAPIERLLAPAQPLPAAPAQGGLGPLVFVSVELCGGTHVPALSAIQAFSLISEEAVAKGVRRVSALTGAAALDAQARASVLGRNVNVLRKRASDSDGERSRVLAETVAMLDGGALGTVPVVDAARAREVMEVARGEEGKLVARAMEEWKESEVKLAHTFVEAHAGAPFVVRVCAVPAGCEASASVMQEPLEVYVKGGVCGLMMAADEKKVVIASRVTEAGKAKLSAVEWARGCAEACGGKGGGAKDGMKGQGTGKEPGKVKEAERVANELGKRLL